jgi:hypothetical protein
MSALFDSVREYDGRFVFTSSKDASAVLDVHPATGAFLFNAGLKNYSGEGSTEALPSTERAPELAREYLAKLRYLPEDQKELVLASAVSINTVSGFSAVV